LARIFSCGGATLVTTHIWRRVWFLPKYWRFGHSARAGATATTAESTELAWIEVQAGFPVARRTADESLRWRQSHVGGLGGDVSGSFRIDAFGLGVGAHHHIPDCGTYHHLVGKAVSGGPDLLDFGVSVAVDLVEVLALAVEKPGDLF
jgi:hypothetical protein